MEDTETKNIYKVVGRTPLQMANYLIDKCTKDPYVKDKEEVIKWALSHCDEAISQRKALMTNDFEPAETIPTIKFWEDVKILITKFASQYGVVIKSEDIFDKDYLKSIGFKVTADSGQYGTAKDIRTNGITLLAWNRDGARCTYFGEPLEKNVSFEIKKDGGTRTAFSGYVYNREQLELIIKLTM